MSRESKFIYPYGPKNACTNEFDSSMDTCDQRAPINDPEALFEQFVVDEEIQEELDDERIEDFDSDIYDYDDRSELGVDIAMSQRAEFAAAGERLASRKKSKARRA